MDSEEFAFGDIRPKTIWEQNPELCEKSVISLRGMRINQTSTTCNYCANPDPDQNHFYMWGLTSSKMRTDDYELMLDRGWQRSGTWYYRPDIKKSCCPLYTPRLDVTEFKLSKSQKKHMRRFNQYINGEREFKLDEYKEPQIKDEKTIKKEKAQEEYDKYIKNLEKERETLKDLIYDSIMNEQLFIYDMMNDQQKQQVKDEMTVENYVHEEPPDNYAYYTCDITDVIMRVTEPVMDKIDYLQSFKIMIGSNKALCDKYKVSSGTETDETILCSSRTYISVARAKKVLFEDDEEDQIVNELNEIKYQETGEEQKIAQDAGNSRPYTDFFDEFVPNTVEESKRAHKYTVSIHKAISYKESFEVFQKFDKVRFDKDRVRQDYESFLTNSSLYDPRDPHFRNTRSYKDTERLDGQRNFKDEGVYPEYHGAYHIHHRIDDKLVAINVWDISERTLGSMYTFYDPAYSFLSLGHVTAIREMEYMRRIREKYNNNMQYYYMGYYVHNCQKSMYKEHMHPQKLLCPFTYTYVPLTPELKAKIVKDQYFQLNEEAEVARIASPAKVLEVLPSFKFVFEQNKWLELAGVRPDMQEQFTKNLISMHKIMGDILFDRFLFEYI